MAGYAGFSKSNNAIAAQESGILPITEATKAVAKSLKLPAYKARVLLEATWGGEWHHCSKHYNIVNHYDTEEAIQQYGDDAALKTKIDSLQKPEKPQDIQYIANVTYLVWGGTRKHPTAYEKKIENAAVVERGDWYIINGFLKKKKTTKGVVVEKI